MHQVIMYTSDTCPYCVQAKRLLAQHGVFATEINIDNDPARRADMVAITQRRSVPQIFIGDRHVGGFDDLAALQRAGRLASMLAPA